jgi:hypothetical protein
MVRLISLIVGVLLILAGLNAWAANENKAPDRSLENIEITETKVFQVEKGFNIKIVPGTYRVTDSENHIRIDNAGARDGLYLPAQVIKHDETLEAPLALTDTDESGTFHIILLLPDGTGLQASCTPIDEAKGLRSRGLRTYSSSRVSTLSTTRLQTYSSTPQVNPTAYTAPKSADLRISAFNLTGCQYDTKTQLIEVTVENAGSAQATSTKGSTTFGSTYQMEVRVEYRPKGTSEWNKFGANKQYNSGPPPGKRYTYQMARGSYQVLLPKEYEFRATVDPNNLLTDSKRVNNTSTKTATVASAPMTISEVKPAMLVLGKPVTISINTQAASLSGLEASIAGSEWAPVTKKTTGWSVILPVAASGPVTIRRGTAQATSQEAVTILGNPTITDISPNPAYVGDTVTITGTNFFPGHTFLYYNTEFRLNQDKDYVQLSEGQSGMSVELNSIRFTVPTNAATGKINIGTGLSVSSSEPLVVLPTVHGLGTVPVWPIHDWKDYPHPGEQIIFQDDVLELATYAAWPVKSVTIGGVPCEFDVSHLQEYALDGVRVTVPHESYFLNYSPGDPVVIESGVHDLIITSEYGSGKTKVRLVRPRITSVSPLTVKRGDWVTVTGVDLFGRVDVLTNSWPNRMAIREERVEIEDPTTTRKFQIPEDASLGRYNVRVQSRRTCLNTVDIEIVE